MAEFEQIEVMERRYEVDSIRNKGVTHSFCNQSIVEDGTKKKTMLEKGEGVSGFIHV